MKNIHSVTSPARKHDSLTPAALLMALALSLPMPAGATHCTSTSTQDSDGDGFLDVQECADITIGGQSFTPSPTRKDLFVVYVPAASGSLLTAATADGTPQPTAIDNPFASVTFYGIPFNGFNALGVTIHKLSSSQLDPFGPRDVVPGTKAIAVIEDLDASDVVLGYCQYGTPASSGVCTIYTRRILDYINSTCAGRTVVTPSGATSSVAEAFKAYTVQTILHEIGHTVGGLTSKYENRYTGYHYAPNTTIMEQYVVAKVNDTAKTCTFYIHKDWNVRNDSPAIKLK